MCRSAVLLTLLSMLAAALRSASCATNLTLMPAQVLLPSTSFYHAPNSNDVIKIHVQVLLRVEPRICVKWEVQNSELLRLLTPNNEETYFDFFTLPPSSFVEGCSSSIWVASVPNATPAISSGAGDQQRSWVYSTDPSTKSKAGAEVIISPMKSIQFKTRNRRIAVNQIATIKIVGHDQFDNTFTSLEGIPFEAHIEDTRILQIIDPRNDPKVATRARLSLLDRKDRFVVSPGYSLTSDTIVLQGKSVGRTKISVKVLLPEYQDIVLKDVEFTVSESIELEPSRLVLPPNASFKFCVNMTQPKSDIDETGNYKINHSNYTWSIAGGNSSGHTIKQDGTITTDKSISGDFTVILTDKRNEEKFTSDFNISPPSQLSVSYGPMRDMLDCFATKVVDMPDVTNMADQNIVNTLTKHLYSICKGSIHCGTQNLAGGVSAKPLAYLLVGRSYLFDMSMRNDSGREIYIPDGYKFAWTVKDDAILTVTKSSNGRFAIVRTTKEGNSTVVIDMESPKLSMEFSVSVTQPVHLSSFPVETTRWTDPSTGEQVTIGVSKKPLIILPNENAKLMARGGSGEYIWKVDNTDICSIKQGILRCKGQGSTVLTLEDKLNPENIFKVQVITKQIKRLVSVPKSLDFEVGTTAQLKVVAYTDIADVSPVFSESWDKKSEDYGQFYSCMSLNYTSDTQDKKLNCRIEHDQFMMDIVKVTEEPFSCGVLNYKALNAGESKVSVALIDADAIKSTELTTSAKVIIYEHLDLSIHPEYTQAPFKTAPQPFMSVSQGSMDKAVFANVAIGGKIRLIATGGPPMKDNMVTLSSCATGASNVYIEKLSVKVDTGIKKTMFDVYCLSETPGEKLCMSFDGSLRNEYHISCRLPAYVEIHPLVPVNNKTVHESLLEYKKHTDDWVADGIAEGFFTTGSNLCYKDDSKSFWQIKLNSNEYHAFRAVVFDAFGNPLSPTHNYKISWMGPEINKNGEFSSITPYSIDNSVYIYKSGDLSEQELRAYLEWRDAFDMKHTSAKLGSVLKAKTVTTLVASNKMWKKSPHRRGLYTLMSSLKLLPCLPHEILIATGGQPSMDTIQRVNIFFNPKVKYQFAVALGSGNYVELSAYTETVKLQHSGTITFPSVEEFSKVLNNVDGITNLFDPMSIKKHITRGGKLLHIPIPVKYMNFFCTTACLRSLEIVDRSQLGQVTKTLVINQTTVAKLQIVITEMPEGNFEDFDSLSRLQTGLQLLTVNRQYRLHAVALDVNGAPMSYASLKDVKFSVGSNTLVKIQSPKDLGYKSVGSAMVIQCLAEGKYTIRAEIQNYKSVSDVANGSVITETMDVTAYKETKPILGSILMMPNSPEFIISMMDNAVAMAFASETTVVMESSQERILKVTSSKHLGHIRSLSTGSCVLTSYIPHGDTLQSKTTTPVKVAVPHSLEIGAPTQVLSGSYIVMHANLKDTDRNIFTPLFVMGSQESDTSSFCTFTWSLNGNGTFVDGADRVPTITGPGKSRVVLLATAPGPVTVTLRSVCRNMGTPRAQVELSAKTLTIHSLVPMNVFGCSSASSTILACESTYESFAGMTESIASVGKDLLTVSSQGVIRTEATTGHVLLKTADNFVTHVQIMNIDQLHIADSKLQGYINVMKSGTKQLEVLLKTKEGQPIVPPGDLKLKAMLSNASLFRVTTDGNRLTLNANSSEGCSALMVLLDKDEQYSNGNLVVDCIMLCVSNALTPQHAVVIKGSTIRFMAGDTKLYGLRLRGLPLIRRYGTVDYKDTLKFYQDVMPQILDKVLNDLKNELSRALFKVLRDMSITPEEDGKGDPQFYMPVLDIYQNENAWKPCYIFTFSLPIELESAVFVSKLTSLLQEFGKTGKDTILSLMEGGVYPIGEGKNASWSVDDMSKVWIKDSQALALEPGKAVVRYEGPHMKGDSLVHVYDKIAMVELQHCGASGSLKNSFVAQLKHQEMYGPFYIALKATNYEGHVLVNTFQMESNVAAICEFINGPSWVKEVFTFEGTYLPYGTGEFLPACYASVRSFGGNNEWHSLKAILKGAEDPGSNIKLHVSIYATRPGDKAASAIEVGSRKVTSQEPLWTIIRHFDTKLWENTFDWKVPMFAQFVDSNGRAIEHVSIESGSTTSLSVYPYYSRCKVTVDNVHYQVRVTEKQGLLCSFSLDNDGVIETASVKLTCSRSVVATLTIANTAKPQHVHQTIVQTYEVPPASRVDLILLLFTILVAGAFAYLVYTLLNRQELKYHETSEPIKIERSIPNVFEKLYQSDYHGSLAPSTAQCQHRRRHPRA